MSFKLDKLKVLVVEDTPPIKNLIVHILTTLGTCQIHVAEDGEKGFDIFCRVNPDIVITDWHMPNKDGIDLLQNIRKSPSSPNPMAPVIMITGYNANNRIATCRDEGVTEYMVKPFTAQDLIMRISHVIKRPRDFIDNSDYFGPDRRRNRKKEYTGSMRRKTDQKRIGIFWN